MILLLISTALSAYYENVVLIHKNGKVKHTTNTVLAAGKTAYSNTDWNETAIQQKYNLPLVIRSGENSSCVLLLAQQTLVFLDRKSLIRISRTPQQKVYAFYCRLIRGRTALEKYQQKNTNSMFYLTAGRIKIKLLKGKNCISYNPRLNTLTAIQK
ncbi:MAG TPA: hypothetical protein VKS21_02310, partial [Spirochaetota bacterium]|nr:hypothetical protein [Spirochaetota bacterium]